MILSKGQKLALKMQKMATHDAPPHNKYNKNKSLFFRLLMILRQAKNPQSGRACAPGGSARQVAGDPPPDGRIVEFLIAVVCEAPCGLRKRLRGRMRARRVGVWGRV